jgi:hypothetical protein
VINIASDKCFGLVDVDQRRLEGNTAVRVGGLDWNSPHYQQDFFPWARRIKKEE